MNIEELYDLYLQYPSVQTDTRKLQKGDIFFALKGNNFNGNQFAIEAIESGASYAVIDEAVGHDRCLIRVDDALTALQQLAKYHREKFSIPFIAVTGSNGKTTTRELVHAVLSSHYIAYATEGNLNNQIGIPLTLLRIKKDGEMAVIEMGANHLKEIESYCAYTLPTHGIITNCGKAHLEGFGGIEGVKKGKGELYDFLKKNNGTAFAFDDYDYLHEMSAGIPEVIWYGTKNGIVTGRVKMSEPFLEAEIEGAAFDSVQTKLAGDYNLPNVLCAIAAGKYFHVPDFKIKAAIENYTPSNSRSQLIKMGSNTVILDAYNANPASMRAAIENFARLHAKNKVLLLGAMMELGDESEKEHEEIVRLINQYEWKDAVFVGRDFKNLLNNFRYFNSSVEAAEWLKQQHFENTYFLVKGSRSMQMEKVLDI